MKFNPFATTCVSVGVLLLAASFYLMAASLTGEPPTAAYPLLVFGVVLIVIPWSRKFTLFKIFEWERHDDK